MDTEKKIKMIVFDWAGTTVDYGSMVPATVFKKVFEEAGIDLTREEINGPMGMEKKAHIRSLLGLSHVSEKWKELYQHKWTEEDVENLYTKFEDTLEKIVGDYSTPLENVTETVAELRKMNLIIGSTTGYTSQIMKKVIGPAEEQGYKPDCVMTPDVAGAGRPTPFMLYECMKKFDVYPPMAVVKVGDTITDIKEGKNAGAWSIGLLTGSNLMGLTKEEADTMDPKELAKRKEETRRKYMEAGADLVLDNISQLPDAVELLNRKMRGEI